MDPQTLPSLLAEPERLRVVAAAVLEYGGVREMAVAAGLAER